MQFCPPPKRKLLINKCLQFIKRIKDNHPEVYWILVTSDSISFLDIAKKSFPYVYVIPGEVFHLDYSSKGDWGYLKSFIDIFMIAGAVKAYNYSTDEMYSGSGFAKNAARIGGTEYENVHE